MSKINAMIAFSIAIMKEVGRSAMKLLKKVYLFYYEGFSSMKIGKKLWVLIFIKLFLLLVVIKWLFFPEVLKTHFDTDTERGQYILEQLTKPKE
jgi:hypothetical protein